HHLLLAAAQAARELRLSLTHPGKEREDAFEVRPDAGAVTSRIGAHLEVLANRHPREQPAPLRRVADSQAGNPFSADLVDRLAPQKHLATRGPDQPTDRPKRRRLDGAVAAD